VSFTVGKSAWKPAKGDGEFHSLPGGVKTHAPEATRDATSATPLLPGAVYVAKMKTSESPLSCTRGQAARIAALLGLLSASATLSPTILASPVLADFSLNVNVDAGPPPPRQEVIVERDRPGPDFVWTAGFWDGSPGRYVWVAGHWQRPPHAHAMWFAPHWERDHDGHFHQVRGEWRDNPHR
jgi:hypothetical protein